MERTRKLKIIITGIVGIFILFSSCDRDNNSPGYNYFPDMTYSRAYESYSDNPNFDNGMTMREPVEGTIPRGYTPLPYTKDLEDRTRAGIDLKNPFYNTPDNLERGKIMFIRICEQCHGVIGDGHGLLYTTKLYPFPPASLVNEKVKNIPDGEIFHTITYGYGVMSEHATIVAPEDRWKIILYIRNELQTAVAEQN
ncbi:MAG: c-type cytochrome [Bacteroidales bacterium]|nr:c-type cytochrome [Bacteroidales bacterium]